MNLPNYLVLDEVSCPGELQVACCDSLQESLNKADELIGTDTAEEEIGVYVLHMVRKRKDRKR